MLPTLVNSTTKKLREIPELCGELLHFIWQAILTAQYVSFSLGKGYTKLVVNITTKTGSIVRDVPLIVDTLKDDIWNLDGKSYYNFNVILLGIENSSDLKIKVDFTYDDDISYLKGYVTIIGNVNLDSNTVIPLESKLPFKITSKKSIFALGNYKVDKTDLSFVETVKPNIEKSVKTPAQLLTAIAKQKAKMQ